MKWTSDQFTRCGLLVLAGLMPWGMYVLGVIGVAWLMSSIYLLATEPKGLPDVIDDGLYYYCDTHPDEFRMRGTTTYGGISPRRHTEERDTENRQTWRDFYDNDKF